MCPVGYLIDMNTLGEDAFQSIADPNRRESLSPLAGNEMTLNQVADNFSVGRPVISKHVEVLRESGLVKFRKRGRQKYCRHRIERLKEVADWLEQYRRFWGTSFNRLDDYLSEVQAKEEKHDSSR